MQVEDFSLIGISSIYVFNGLVLLMNCPHSTACIPDKVLWKLLIEEIMCSSSNKIRILVCLELSKQLTTLSILDHLINLSISTKDHRLLTW